MINQTSLRLEFIRGHSTPRTVATYENYLQKIKNLFLYFPRLRGSRIAIGNPAIYEFDFMVITDILYVSGGGTHFIYNTKIANTVAIICIMNGLQVALSRYITLSTILRKSN